MVLSFLKEYHNKPLEDEVRVYFYYESISSWAPRTLEEPFDKLVNVYTWVVYGIFSWIIKDY